MQMDAGIVLAAQRGDEQAFAAIVDASVDRLLGIAERILRDAQLAEDATQQALVQIWQSLPELREPERFEAWSYRVLVRACYAEHRRRRRWLPNLRLLPGDGAARSDEVSGVVERDQLERGFERLSFDHRAVLVLRYYLDLPDDAVAESLHVPVGTVFSRLNRARAALRAALEADARPASATRHSEAAR